MPLVEVVQAEGDDGQAQARACAFVGQLDKLPLPVFSAPGFLVNAVLAPYMLEAMRCVDEGMSIESIDAAMIAFGMPMGPLELADTVGLDIAMAAGAQLADGAQPPRCLQAHISQQRLGRKTGSVLLYLARRQTRQTAAPVPAGLAQRLIQPLIARTRLQLEAGVVADQDLADAGVIFGTGFAPFTGGPLFYQSRQRTN